MIAKTNDQEESSREKMYGQLKVLLAEDILAILAAVLGFCGIAGGLASIAQIAFYVFLVFFLVSAVASALRGRAPV